MNAILAIDPNTASTVTRIDQVPRTSIPSRRQSEVDRAVRQAEIKVVAVVDG